MYEWNEWITTFTCIRCKHEYEPDDYFKGCPRCLEQGYPASIQVNYDASIPWTVNNAGNGMLRYADRLPYRTFPTLGEGATPLIEVKGVEEELGVSSVWIKDEGQNPTGSHKDRMSPLVVARAANLRKTTVVAASSGNAGASLAAYAAAAGLDCKIITTPQVHGIWEKAIRITGADIIKVDNAVQRWEVVNSLVEEEGFYPATNYHLPPVGSNLFGVQGYVTVGLEIAEQMHGASPTAIVVPCARGDLLWGIWAGFVEAKRLQWVDRIPRLYAVEPFPRLVHALAGHDYRGDFFGDSRLLPSIGGHTLTYQALSAIQSSGGGAVVVTNEEVPKAQRDLARKGMFAEGSAAATWPALAKLVQSGRIKQDDRTVLLLTSHGYKGV